MLLTTIHGDSQFIKTGWHLNRPLILKPKVSNVVERGVNMKIADRIFRVIHIILCCVNIGSLFFGIMVLSGGGNIVYSFLES